jgi:hypothetical protein
MWNILFCHVRVKGLHDGKPNTRKKGNEEQRLCTYKHIFCLYGSSHARIGLKGEKVFKNPSELNLEPKNVDRNDQLLSQVLADASTFVQLIWKSYRNIKLHIVTKRFKIIFILLVLFELKTFIILKHLFPVDSLYLRSAVWKKEKLRPQELLQFP